MKIQEDLSSLKVWDLAPRLALEMFAGRELQRGVSPPAARL